MRKWKLVSTERLYHSKYMSVFKDTVVLPNMQEIMYSRAELRDFVSILPISENKIVMIEIFRYPANRSSLEIPSGFIENRENPRDCAFRELEEETGYKAEKLRSMGWFYPWTRSIRKAHLFLAQHLTKGVRKPDVTEQIKVKLLPVSEASKAIETCRVTHAPTIIALRRFLLMHSS